MLPKQSEEVFVLTVVVGTFADGAGGVKRSTAFAPLAPRVNDWVVRGSDSLGFVNKLPSSFDCDKGGSDDLI